MKPRMGSSLLTLGCFVSLLVAIAAGQSVKKIAFPKFATPPGYEKYDPTKLTEGTEFIFGGVDVPFPYRSYAKKWAGFSYDVVVDVPGLYDVKLGFYDYESSFGNCAVGKRVFKFKVNNKVTADIDVFKSVGCGAPYHVTVKGVQSEGTVIKLTAQRVAGFAPFLANVEVTKVGGGGTDVDTGSPTKPTAIARVVLSNGKIPNGWTQYETGQLSKGVKFATTTNTAVWPAFRSVAFKWAGFTYTHKVPPGTYSVVLGFAEFKNCKIGKRVFKVQVNNKSAGPYDIFKTVQCNKAYISTIAGVVVKADGILTIKPTRESGAAPFLANFQVFTTAPVTTTVPPTTTKPDDSGSGGSSTASGKLVKFVDVGGPSDIAGSVTGTSQVYPNVFSIKGADDIAKYSKHRFGADFSYGFSVKPNIVYDVTLFFAESYLPGCKDGFREFNVQIHDGSKAPDTGKSLLGLDIYKLAGCRTAYTTAVKGVSVGASGQLALKFTGVVENAMISAFQVTTNDEDYEETPTTKPPSTGDQVSSVKVNVGAPGDGPVPGTSKFSTTKAVKGTASATGDQLKTARFGADFKYTFNLKPGAYDVILSFSENFDPNFCSEEGKRVFNVYINDKIQLEAYDIFAAAGCLTGIDVKISETVGAVDTKPMVIRFSSVTNYAQVNYITIKPAPKACVPESTNGGFTADHQAHSVPGTYPPQDFANSPKFYVDNDGDGKVTVTLDGRQSHSHFLDSDKNIIGRVTEYTWSLIETNEVISKAATFSYSFPLGTTRVKLSVVDNVCTSDEAETSVTVTGTIQPGQYCYYYAGLKKLPHIGKKGLKQQPNFAAMSPTTSLGFPKFSFDTTKFAVRCSFFLQVDEASEASKISISTGGTGDAKVYKGEDLIIDTESASKATTSLPVGLIGFEVVYLRTSVSKPPQLSFFVNDTLPAQAKISHDQITIRPILTAVSPSTGNVGGGGTVKVTGYGLFDPLTVQFGDKSVPILPFGRSPTQFFVKVPPSNKATTVEITVTSDAKIKSNAVNFEYGSSCDPISFKQTAITQADGGPVNNLEIPTCVAIGQDGKLYMGTRGATVQVLEYDVETLTTTSQCYSKALTDSRFKNNGKLATRDITGITFDPRDKEIKPYVTSGSIFWNKWGRIEASNKQRWMTGAVDRLKVGSDASDAGICLVYDKRIVSNMPVSDHDHTVNALLFDQNGDLLISVGGNTNLGLPGYKLGGYWENELSAAILVAKLSKPGYNGYIQYTSDAVRLAKKKSGDVDLYATGLRNSYGMTMKSDGEVYSTDNGPNCSFGNTAISCDDYNEADAAKWDPTEEKDWPGKVKKGFASCPYSLSRKDKILHITEGSWYGHANIQRGPPECAYIDPETDQTADGKPAPSKYKKPMALVKSATTGINEYTANHFCGKLRGELILSTYQNGNTYRMKVNKGSTLSGPDFLFGQGGLSFVQNAQGDLIFPRYSVKDVFVLRPNVTPYAQLFISGAVPARHGKAGGTLIYIGGSNFGPMPKVMIGTGSCAIERSSDTEIVCKVPPNSGSNVKQITVTTDSGESAVLPNAVLYMNV